MSQRTPTSPIPGAIDQFFLPGFLMGDLPTRVTPQPRPSMGVMEMRSPLLAGGSPPKPVVPSNKAKGGAPPVKSMYDDVYSPYLGTTYLQSRKQSVMGSWEKSSAASSPYVFIPLNKNVGTARATTMQPLAAAYKAASDYQVVAGKQIPRTNESIVYKVLEYLFGC